MHIKMVGADDAAGLSRFYIDNYSRLKDWKPQFEEIFRTSAWTNQLLEQESEVGTGRSMFFIALEEDTAEILALCSLLNIVRGPFQAAHMAYAVAKTHEGKGLMRQLCLHVIRYGFNELRLQRIIANYLPANQRSARLLTRLGFEREGFARKYLFINGKWEDHVLAALINPASIKPAHPGRY